jgi:hypothetical protein
MSVRLSIRPPAYYDVVLLLDRGERVQFSQSALSTWNGDAQLAPVTTRTFRIDPDVVFNDQRIIAVRHDETGALVIELTNRTTLQVVTEHNTLIQLERLPP